MLEDGGPWGVNLVSRMFAASGWREFELTDRSTAGTTEWPFNYPHDICGVPLNNSTKECLYKQNDRETIYTTVRQSVPLNNDMTECPLGQCNDRESL